MQAKPNQLHIVDVLRFVSAMLVVGYHYGSSFPRSPSLHARAVLAGAPAPLDIYPATWFGWVGVSVFFVISGFVIAISAEGSSAGDFARRRMLRLLPAAWICATISLCLLAAAHAAPLPVLLGRWATSVVLSPIGQTIDGAYWTLIVELWFYVAVTLALALRGDGSVERFALIIGAPSLVFWVLLLLGWGGSIVQYSVLPLVQQGCYFALGMSIWGVVSKGISGRRIVTMVAMGGASITEILSQTICMSRNLKIHVSPMIPLMIFGVAVVLLLASRRLQPALARPGTIGITTTLGLMTYPLYLFHQDGGAVVLATLLRLGVPNGAAIVFVLALALSTAFLIARFAEPMIRQWLRRAMTPAPPFIALAQR